MAENDDDLLTQDQRVCNIYIRPTRYVSLCKWKQLGLIALHLKKPCIEFGVV